MLGRAIRTERYRLVEWRGPNGDAVYELYDYATDSLERENLVQKHPDIVAELKGILARHPVPVARKRGKAKALQGGAKQSKPR